MPIRPFKNIPRNLVEWASFFQQASVRPDAGSVGGNELQDGSVTYDKLQTVSASRLLGRGTGSGVVQEINAGGGLEISGAQLQIANAGVTYSKIQNVTSDRILGRSSITDGVVEEIVCTAAGRALLDDADAASQRTTLGLGSAALANIGNIGGTVPLLSNANTHASARATLFAVDKAPVGTQAANADTSGATLAQLETEVNELKAVLRAFGLISP